jgi:hypothetical protein
MRRAKRACKQLFTSAKVYRYCRPGAMRLRETYEWIRGKPLSAREWWEKSIKAADEMGARYDLAMTYLEMGKRLNDRDHLHQAEAIFADAGAESDPAETRRFLHLIVRN